MYTARLTAIRRLCACAAMVWICTHAGVVAAAGAPVPQKDVLLVPPQSAAAPVTGQPSGSAIPRDARQAAFGAALGDLGFFLLSSSRGSDAHAATNSLVSPFSVANILGLLHAGAADTTASEIAAVLYPGTVSGRGMHAMLRKLNDVHGGIDGGAAVQWKTSNRVWMHTNVAHQLTAAFAAQARDSYRADGVSVDFDDIATSRNAINDWARQATNGKVTTLIPEQGLPPNTRVVLTNAIYFHGSWRQWFDPSHTQPAPFHNVDGSTAQVATMAGIMQVGRGESGKLQIVELPYSHPDFSLLIAMPQEGTALLDIEAGLEGADIAGWLSTVKPARVDLRLPRFSIPGESISLKSALQQAGMKRAFSPAADFGPMLGKSGITISDIFHAAGIDVFEQGSEAVAGTAAVARAKSLPPMDEVTVLRIDRPFIFTLMHKRSGTPLFIGRIANLK